MSRDRQFLKDILEAARLAQSYVAGKTREEFLADTQCQDAVVRRLEIVGEAARRLSESTRSTLSDLPWRKMIGMRNIVIHGYDAVDLAVVGDTARRDIPGLITLLEPLLESGEV